MRSTFKILFYIHQDKIRQDGWTTIFCRITIDGVSTVLTTGETCLASDWIPREGRTKCPRINQRLLSFKERIERSYQTLLARDGVIHAAMLKQYVRGEKKLPKHLLEVGREELQRLRESIGSGTSESGYMTKLIRQRVLERFVQSLGREDIPLETLRGGFFEDYRLFLKKQSYAPRTMNNLLGWLEMLMHLSVRQQIIRSNPFEGAKYERIEAKPRYLRKGEVAQLLSFCPEDEEVEQVRRMFLFTVFTGLSWVDLIRLTPTEIETHPNGARYIRQKRQKTKVEAVVPLHSIAEEILRSFGYEALRQNTPIFQPSHSTKKMQTILLTLGLACGISERLTFHVGRHTFGTMALSAGIPMESIAKMMGHASIRSTQIYALITDQKIAEDMDKLLQLPLGDLKE